jgi:surface carbohydrate biosynthesis protein
MCPPVLSVRGEELNLLVLMRALFRKGSIKDTYEDCFIEAVNPLLVLTFIDNSPRFYLLSDRHTGVRTMFIQNGWRGGVWDIFHTIFNTGPSQLDRRCVDVMCTYGAAIGREYTRHLRGHPVATGSFLCNEYPIAPDRKKTRRIAYISIYTGNETVDQPVALGLRELLRYSKTRGVPLVVVGRRDSSREPRGCAMEEQYYRNLLGDDFEFLKRNAQHSSYKYLDESEVSVSIDSSIGYESVARGNKNAFFSILGNYTPTHEFNFGWPAQYPNEGPFWTNKPDPAAFERILDHLFTIDDAQWRAELATCRYDDIMIYDPGNTILKKILHQELSADQTTDRQPAVMGCASR